MTKHTNAFLNIRNKTGMYLLKESYVAVASYIEGYNQALEGEVLNGFKEWLVVKGDLPDNLTWSVLVLDFLNLDDCSLTLVEQSNATSRLAINKLVNLYVEFDKTKTELGLKQIIENHRKLIESRNSSGEMQTHPTAMPETSDRINQKTM